MHDWQLVQSKTDILGADFTAHTYRFQGPVSQVETTLIEHNSQAAAQRGILYLHGYTDYFFQADLAKHFSDQGFRFFALDLQGYGRSIRPNSLPNWCESLNQYDDDLLIALSEMRQKGVDEVYILAHSTGGLIAANFAQAHFRREQFKLPKLKGLILNSPFLALPFSSNRLKYLQQPTKLIVSLLPFCSLKARNISVYARTLHKQFEGEWDYRLDWKPAQGFPLSFHWLKHIIQAQQSLIKQPIELPTLVCHSALTTRKLESVELTRNGDGVLNVESMVATANQAFKDLSLACIEGGYHDLFLSPINTRQKYLAQIDQWLTLQK